MAVQACEQEQPIVDVTGIEISLPCVEITVGQTVQLNAVVIPQDATDNAVEWMSLDASVASVDETGLVTALEKGNTIVVARSGEIVKECEVTVFPVPVSGIVLNKSEVDIKVGESLQLTATVSPDVAEFSEISWMSSDNKIVTVDNSGKISSVGSGVAMVTASVEGFAASCLVYSLGDPKVGDLYYSDGRWFTSPVEGEVPVGIIFYVGDPAEYDKALRKDHPECTHGIALSLFTEISATLQPNISLYKQLISDWAFNDEKASEYVSVLQDSKGDYLNRIMGYNNTCVMELFNEDPDNAAWPLEIIDVLNDVRNAYTLPKETSGWYIPSAKELSLMCNGNYDGNIGEMDEMEMNQKPDTDMEAFLAQKIYEIPGAALFSPVYYISSTEQPIFKDKWGFVYFNQWSIRMNTGYVFGQPKDQKTAVLRPVFAF